LGVGVISKGWGVVASISNRISIHLY
jgi:hypothetical protein